MRFAVLLVLAGCSLDGLSSGPATADASDAKSDAANAPPDAAADATPFCGVQKDKRLYCTNLENVPLNVTASHQSNVVDHLKTRYSWFTCWTKGTDNPSTWFYTQGDDKNAFGYVSAEAVMTTSEFNLDPSAMGFAHCP
ncbi:hypothetical protein BH09MYX1_BH09MYX1_26300 [soil metagenome]